MMSLWLFDLRSCYKKLDEKDSVIYFDELND